MKRSWKKGFLAAGGLTLTGGTILTAGARFSGPSHGQKA
jgi:hypothetical protein